MAIVKKTIFFLIINFGALAIGSWLMNNGPASEWYINLNKAPWTPPGWVFGAAWTTIMVCFSIYLAYLFAKGNQKRAVVLFLIQLVLNISWNYIFFNQHLTKVGLVFITLLNMVLFTFFFSFNREKMKSIRYLLLPYMIWLCIATSLNAYVVFNN